MKIHVMEATAWGIICLIMLIAIPDDSTPDDLTAKQRAEIIERQGRQCDACHANI